MKTTDNKRRILVVAPHPDDETLGCGATLRRHVLEGDEVHWLIVTGISVAQGFSHQRVQSRAAEIDMVAGAYGFSSTTKLDFPTATLDAIPKGDLVRAVSAVFNRIEPNTVYVPYRNDAHTDHAAVFDAVAACTKSFRYPFVKSVLAYETLSETEFGLRPEDPGFRPNLFVDVTRTAEDKIRIMGMFEGEMAAFPFPRSVECLRAQLTLRGSQAGVQAAESFQILKEIR